MSTTYQAPPTRSVDEAERASDFLRRHGGPAPRDGRSGGVADGSSGWSELYSADGHVLRCEWSREGNEVRMKYSELVADYP